MRMYQDTRRLDFHALGREIKRKREAKGWTQEYLAQLVDRNRGRSQEEGGHREQEQQDGNKDGQQNDKRRSNQF